jgi:hypothetical protein
MKKFNFDTSATSEGGIRGPSSDKDLEAKLQVMLDWASNIDSVIGSVNQNAMMTVLSIDVLISLLIEKGVFTNEEFTATHAALLRQATGTFDQFFLDLIDKIEKDGELNQSTKIEKHKKTKKPKKPKGTP